MGILPLHLPSQLPDLLTLLAPMAAPRPLTAYRYRQFGLRKSGVIYTRLVESHPSPVLRRFEEAGGKHGHSVCSSLYCEL